MSSSLHKRKAPRQNSKAPPLKTFWRRFWVDSPIKPEMKFRCPPDHFHHEPPLDKTTLNAQLVTAGLKRDFYHLKSVDCERSDLWKSFGCKWKERTARFCCLL